MKSHASPFHLIGNFVRNQNCTEMAEGTKNERLKTVLNIGYGQITYENETFLAKLQANVKLYHVSFEIENNKNAKVYKV